METKDKKIQVHTIDYKDIDKFFPAHSEITMSPLPKGHIARLATIHKVKAQLKTSRWIMHAIIKR